MFKVGDIVDHMRQTNAWMKNGFIIGLHKNWDSSISFHVHWPSGQLSYWHSETSLVLSSNAQTVPSNPVTSVNGVSANPKFQLNDLVTLMIMINYSDRKDGIISSVKEVYNGANHAIEARYKVNWEHGVTIDSYRDSDLLLISRQGGTADIGGIPVAKKYSCDFRELMMHGCKCGGC